MQMSSQDNVLGGIYLLPWADYYRRFKIVPYQLRPSLQLQHGQDSQIELIPSSGIHVDPTSPTHRMVYNLPGTREYIQH